MPDLPPEAWDVIFKSGNAWAILLGIVAWRHHETLGKLKEDIAVLKTRLSMKGTNNGDV